MATREHAYKRVDTKTPKEYDHDKKNQKKGKETQIINHWATDTHTGNSTMMTQEANSEKHGNHMHAPQ